MEGTLERKIPATSSIPAEGDSTEDESGKKAGKVCFCGWRVFVDVGKVFKFEARI